MCIYRVCCAAYVYFSEWTRFAFIWFVFLERTLILKLDYSCFFFYFDRWLS